MFQNVNTQGAEAGGDRIGRVVLPSNIYEFTVKMAYGITSSRSKAEAVVLHLTTSSGAEVRETIWVTNGKGEATYTDKNTGKPKLMPGWEMVNDLAMFITEKPLEKQVTEEKLVNIYNFDTKKDEPTAVPVFVDLIGGSALAAIFESKEDKTKQNPTTGNYDPTGETYVINTIDKFMYPGTKGTMHEHSKGMEPGQFYKAWLDKNQGKQRDNSKGTAPKSGMPGMNQGSNAGASGQQSSGGGSSLFDRTK